MEDLCYLYANTLNDFKTIMNLTTKELMVLEAVSYKLQEIERITSYNGSMECISYSKYAFNYNDVKIINMFLDTYGNLKVNPISYYGIDNIKNSKIISLMKDLINSEFNGNLIELKQMNDLAAMIIGKIQIEVYPLYFDGMLSFKTNGVRVIDPFFNNRNKKVDPYKEYDNYDNTDNDFINIVDKYYISNEVEKLSINIDKSTQKNIIMYLMKYNNEDISYFFDDYLSTFFIVRYEKATDSARKRLLSFLDLLQDEEIFLNKGNKITICNLFYFLFYYIYEKKCGHTNKSQEDIFKSEIIKNYKLRDIFFKSVNLIMNDYPNTDIFDLIKNS